MQKRLLIFLTVTLLLVFGITPVAIATGMGWDGGPHKWKSDKMLFSPVEQLDLTEQQITQMREINQDTYKQTRELRIKLMDSVHELKQLKLQKNPDQAKIDAKIKEINDLRDKLHGIIQQSREQCQSLLTQKQRDQLNQLRGKKGGAFKGKFETEN